MIFLSDGLAPLADEVIYDVCRSAVRQGFVNLRIKCYFRIY
jgi:hypothetical protein